MQLSSKQLMCAFAVRRFCSRADVNAVDEMLTSKVQTTVAETMLTETRMSAFARLEMRTTVDLDETFADCRMIIVYKLPSKPRKVLMAFEEDRTRYWIYLSTRYLLRSFMWSLSIEMPVREAYLEYI